MIKEVELKTYDDEYKAFGEVYRDEDENEELVQKQFVVDSLSSADWVMRKIKENKDRSGEIIDYAKEEIQRLQLFIKKEESRRDNNVAYLEHLLENYLLERREEDPNFKLKTVTGTASTRKSTSWNYDDEKLIDFLKKNDMAEFIRVKEEVNKSDFKKAAIVTDSGVVVTEAGEVIDGVEVTQEEKLSIRFS
ncbi:host-nuclease inhibitor Gam family protein [Peptoniphilus duerdenii]|uniref:host-nuclease inhibitor Gam family protein n=1 Tax=Peptoniphilus duerdenii TaxID=507750 RepID=UPI00288927E8|nr:host-nuclease inhibitor Gam family protein [Peptoniphilus duerdenii]